MLDPLTGLGVAVNVIQLADFGLSVFQKGREITRAGLTNDQEHLRHIARSLADVCEKLPVAEIECVSVTNPLDITLNPDLAATDGSTPTIKSPVFETSVLRAAELASRARKTADKLNILLGKLTLDEGTRKRKRNAVACAIKGKWKERDVNDARKQLSELHWQLLLNLQIMQEQKTSDILAAMERWSDTHIAERGDRLHALKESFPEVLRMAQHYVNHVERPTKTVTSAMLKKLDDAGSPRPPEDSDTEDSSAPDVLRNILRRVPLQERTAEFCRRLVRELSFAELHMRHEVVAEAHQKTFSWIYEREDLGFVDWAHNDCGEQVYWITGKPGSGKSTLMKFLAMTGRTTDLLTFWAGSCNLVVATFFFWHAGTEMQRSQVGLLRSLLIQLVRSCPESAEELLEGQSILHWTKGVLIETINAIVQHCATSTRFCFFIDGLDEYSGEFSDIVELLESLVQSDGVKLCVSSRPHNTFQRNYGKRARRHLAVQDLTHEDIIRFTSDRLQSNDVFQKLREQDTSGCDALVSEIDRKAQGVFLWVALAIRSLIRGLDNDGDLVILHQRLEEFPETLDGFFRRMFNGIDSVYNSQAARIMLAACHYAGPLALHTPTFIANEVFNPNYVVQMPIDFTDGPISAIEIGDVKRRLHARCGDLLEVASAYHGVSFCHRTAFDWMHQTCMQEALRHNAGKDFSLDLSLAKVCMARIKSSSLLLAPTIVEELLSYEHKIPSSSMSTYLSLFESFVAASDTMLQGKCFDNEVATMLHGSEPERNQKIDMSVELTSLAFRATSILDRLRKDHGFSEEAVFLDSTQENDIKILFGIT